MGFEADECVQFSSYGIANMQANGYVCIIVRDCTTTYEVAETVAGLWKTKLAIITIEARFGYSIAVDVLLAVVRAP